MRNFLQCLTPVSVGILLFIALILTSMLIDLVNPPPEVICCCCCKLHGTPTESAK